MNKGLWHCPQSGALRRCSEATRLVVWQWGQTMCSASDMAGSTVQQGAHRRKAERCGPKEDAAGKRGFKTLWQGAPGSAGAALHGATPL
ncbi:hypothetical protein GCM10023090_20880 [Acidovorax lacteus]|uniref:Uncharacterized protein n=1 Tax=Acidovorax lacteus TaxID=1924988 RepID=A0ABP8LAF7_9BURK